MTDRRTTPETIGTWQTKNGCITLTAETTSAGKPVFTAWLNGRWAAFSSDYRWVQDRINKLAGEPVWTA